ncbi:MAG: hypothetical protein QNJ48_05415 [Desulfobacterales bacterium]|nr:hypothetical protein [Desulfobacterales bacterium]MDJ0883575.1 hypothetical protein [Desulfobacterales bacterium]
MKITKKTLELAVAEKIISTDQMERLLDFLEALPATGPRFDFTHVLYYLGGLTAIGAMTLFMNLGWENFGGWGIFIIALAYAAIGLKLCAYFKKRGHVIPAGICAAFVVALTPLAIYGLQQAMGWWPDETAYRDYHHFIRWHWIYLELGTLAAGAIVAYLHRYPFLLMPIAVTLWYMSMDVAAMLVIGRPNFELRALVSMYFGLAMMLLAFWVDIRSAKSGDYAFWLYLFGVMTFWGGMTSQHSDSELSKFIYFCINLSLMGAGVILVRRVFVIFGALGGAIYLGHLANEVFEDSWLFPVALTAIGLGIIYLGVVWQKNEKRITQKARSFLPTALRDLLAERTAS